MIESCENALQIAVLLVCVFAALHRAIAQRSRMWTLLTFFYGSWLLGDLYWLLCLVFFERTPQVSVVSDLSWHASYLFLYLLLRQASPPQQSAEKRPAPWLGPVFTAGMAVFFLQWGKLLTNTIYAVLMGTLLYAAIRRLTNRKRYGGQAFLSASILAFCLLEYALWTASCFWSGETLRNPYYWFDLLLTACFPFFLPAAQKAVVE